MAIEITSKNFHQEIIDTEDKVLIDFHAPWCGPCKMLSPVLAELEKEKQNFKICKIDVDQSPELADQFNVMSIPTLIAMNKGKVEHKMSGLRPKQDIIAMMYLAAEDMPLTDQRI